MDARGVLAKMPAALLGFEGGEPYALALNVREGDLLTLSERASGCHDPAWRHFQIGVGFELLPLEIAGRDLTFEERLFHLKPQHDEPLKQPGSCDDDLRAVLAEREYPEWLAAILARQVRNWREREPAKYFLLVPSSVTDAEIAACVSVAPYAALRFFKARLSEEELLTAIHDSIEGGVRFAFGWLTQEQIDRACWDCPGVLLAAHATRISDDQLQLCSNNDPAVAFDIRKSMPPRRHAIVLANSYVISLVEKLHRQLPNFEEEVEESLIRYPDVWLKAHWNDFGRLFRALAAFAEIRTNWDFMSRLLLRLPAEFRSSLALIIAQQV
ncbi:MAG: hypothetical protein WCK77_11455 [Verrucomicrobiota bacterium]